MTPRDSHGWPAKIRRLLLGGCLTLAAAPVFGQADSSAARAQVTAVEQTLLAAPRAGRLQSVAPLVGDSVTRGETLITFDCRMERAELAAAQARKKAATAQHAVNQRLAKFDNVSNLEVRLSEASLEEAGAELERVRAQNEDCAITAPFSAEITERQVQPYQYVRQGDPMLALTNLQHLQIEVVIPAAWLDRVEPGTPMTFVTDATQYRVPAAISRIVDRVDPVSQTIKVIATPNQATDRFLKPGMSGEALFGQPDANPQATPTNETGN